MAYGKLAMQCGQKFEVRVLSSNAGYYIGTVDEDGLPFSRESDGYYRTRDDAAAALEQDNWVQKKYP